MKSIYSPFTNNTNTYVSIIKRALISQGIQTYDVREVIKKKNIKEIEVANFNWLESKINQKSMAGCVINYIKNILLIYFLKVNSIKIVFTLHNKIPHDCKYPLINRMFIRFMCKQSDAVVGLCNETKEVLGEYVPVTLVEKKTWIIPHPSYENECRNYYVPVRKKCGALTVLFVGAVKRYKNIELILEVADSLRELPIKFVIKGKAEDSDYEIELREKLGDKSNVDLEFGFLEDEELYRSVSEADVLILPYDISSSLNSGTLYLAFSLERNVICPTIGTVKEFADNLIYSYTYNTREDHFIALRKKVIQVYSEYNENWNIFKARAVNLYQIMQENNSESKIGELYKKMYNYIVNG